MHGPTHHAPGADIQDGDQIQPALAGQDASGIGHPNLVGTLHGKTWEAVRCDGSAVTTVGRGHAIPGALTGEESLAPHEPGNAVTPARTTQGLG